jgi:hypothetical protein
MSQSTESYNEVMARQSNNQTEPLLIDRAAAAELPSAQAVREWAGEKRAFISSVMAELAAERQAVAEGIRAVGLRPVMFEGFGGRDADLGTRATSQVSRQRRGGRRIVFSNHRMQFRTDDAPVANWTFPPPIGTQAVVAEFTTADSITIPHHLRTSEVRTYMTLAPLKDLDDPDLSPPPATDNAGRSAQTFLVEVIARVGNEERRAVAKGRDIYAFTAPLVVEATQRVVSMRGKAAGVFAAGEIFDARDFLKSLCPAHLSIEIQ